MWFANVARTNVAGSNDYKDSLHYLDTLPVGVQLIDLYAQKIKNGNCPLQNWII